MNATQRLRGWLSNPWVGGISLGLAIVSIIITIYFGMRPGAQRRPQLFREEKSIVVYDPQMTEAFSLRPERVAWPKASAPRSPGKVYARQFAIWNSGGLAIKPENILKQLRVQIGSDLEKAEAVWEVRATAWSREEVDFRIGDVVEEGALLYAPIEFRILERGDGALLQVIYTGPEDLPITLRGTVEGVRGNAFGPAGRADRSRVLAMVPVFAFSALVTFLSWRTSVRPRRRAVLIINVTQILLILAMAAILLTVVGGALTSVGPIPKFPYHPGL